MKKIIDNFELNFSKKVGLKIDFNPEIPKDENDKIRENRYLFATDDLEKIKFLTLRNNGEYAVRDIGKDEAKQELERYWHSHLIQEWQLEKEKELEKLEEKIINQEKIIKNREIPKEVKNEKIENKKFDFEKFYKIKVDFKPLGLDFFSEKNIKKMEKEQDQIHEKVEKMSFKIKKFDINMDIKSKDELFNELEIELSELKLDIKNLKSENQELRKELELLVEKQKAENEKQKIEKENMSLREKIENIKNRTKEARNDFEQKTSEFQKPEKARNFENKISLKKEFNNEREM